MKLPTKHTRGVISGFLHYIVKDRYDVPPGFCRDDQDKEWLIFEEHINVSMEDFKSGEVPHHLFQCAKPLQENSFFEVWLCRLSSGPLVYLVRDIDSEAHFPRDVEAKRRVFFTSTREGEFKSFEGDKSQAWKEYKKGWDKWMS